MKNDNYVIGILNAFEDRTEIKYVTNVNYSSNYAQWKAGEKAAEFSKDMAADVALGLCFNGYAAIPMLKANYLDLKNPEEKNAEHSNEELAERFVNAIKMFAENPEDLETLESYLAQHFDTWLCKFTHDTESFVTEMETFASRKDGE